MTTPTRAAEALLDALQHSDTREMDIEIVKAALLALDEPASHDEKLVGDQRQQFSRLDMDAATKPLHAEIERLKARDEPAAPARSAWQPIADAPRDGSPISVWLGDCDDRDAEFYCAPGCGRLACCPWHWREGRFRPVMGIGLPIVTVRPTLFQLLPAPPTTGGTAT